MITSDYDALFNVSTVIASGVTPKNILLNFNSKFRMKPNQVRKSQMWYQMFRPLAVSFLYM